MPIEILMPALSPTMTEGNLAKWLKKEGDEVHSGDVLAEIETDKATMEFEAVDDGRLGKILVPEGAQGIKVNQPIAVLLGEGEDASRAAARRRRKPRPRPAHGGSAGDAVEPQRAAGPCRGGRDPRATATDRIFASPLARRMAQQAGLDLAASAARDRKAASSRPTSRRPWLTRRRAARQLEPAGASRCTAGADRRAGSCPRSRWWRSPATRPTPKRRSPRCGASSPGA